MNRGGLNKICATLAALAFLCAWGRCRAAEFAPSVMPGWNMVSAPMSIGGYDLPDQARLYDYQCNCYATPEEFEPGRGFWFYMPPQGSAVFYGFALSPETPVQVPLKAGWNMIGNPFEEPVAFDDQLTLDGTGLFESPLYESGPFSYNGYEYVDATQLRPGRAYWIKVADDCTLTIPFTPITDPGVTASANPVSITILAGEARTMLTCETTGEITLLEAACSGSDPWQELTGEQALECVYTEPGVLTPRCRANGELTSLADPAVTVHQEPTVAVQVQPLWNYLDQGAARVELVCQVNGSVSTVEGRCEALGDWVPTDPGAALDCDYDRTGNFTPACRLGGIAVHEAETPVLIEDEPELIVTAEPWESTLSQGQAPAAITCAADATILSMSARCSRTGAWVEASAGHEIDCLYSQAGEFYPACLLNEVYESESDSPVVIHAEPGVTASASPTSISLYQGQAQTTLTCSTQGQVFSLEGRCRLHDPWTGIDSGDTMTCAYAEPGIYTPGCRMNGELEDDADPPVTVSEQATVTAAADPTTVVMAEGQAQSTLTCSTAGTVNTLLGRCHSSDSWRQLSLQKTLECTYYAAGQYAPACLLNQTIVAEADPPVTVEPPPITDQLVMIEAFANTGCPHCVTSIPQLEEAVESFSGQALLVVYHIADSYEAPGAMARWDYYSGSGVPSIYIDGSFKAHGGNKQYYIDLISPHIGRESAIFITVGKQKVSGVIRAHIEIEHQGEGSYSNLTLRSAVIENLGTGGYKYLYRGMFETQTVNLAPGTRLEFTLDSAPMSEPESSYAVVTFLQVGDKTIVQAASD